MVNKRRFFWLVFAGFILVQTGFAQNQTDYVRRFQNGAQLYGLTRWNEAAVEFRRAQEIAVNPNDWSQALYWVILSELANSDYGSALRDMEELERAAPSSTYTRDMIYHRARVYYLQGFFEDALLLFNRFCGLIGDSDRVSADRRAASYFWMGECLYSMGQYDEAEKFYAWVVARYPQSPKVEASAYRLDLITQKKIEAELLRLLQLSHEESLRTSEEHQRTIRTYEYTLNIYQRRIAELTNQISSLNHNGQDIPEPQPRQIVNIPEPRQTVSVQEPRQTINIPENINVIAEQPPNSGITTAQPPQLNESLIDRARLLGSNVEDILREGHRGGGAW